MKGSDSYLTFKELSRFDGLKISAIRNGLEKCMAFTVNKNMVFINSMLFVNSSLDKLLKKITDNDFVFLSEEFSGEQLKLVKEKGISPYEYMNSYRKFNETKLPDKSKFFSSLQDCGINEKELQRAINFWKVFEIKNLGEYHDLYLKTDVSLLCEFLKIY